MFWWYLIFTILSIAFLIVAMVYSAMAASEAKKGKTDEAHKNAMITAILTGVTAGVILLTFILVMIYGAKKNKPWSPQAHYAAMKAANEAYTSTRQAYSPQ